MKYLEMFYNVVRRIEHKICGRLGHEWLGKRCDTCHANRRAYRKAKYK